MTAFLANFVGLWLIAGGLVAVVIDGTKSIAASQLTVTPLGQAWFAFDRGSLTAFQGFVREEVEGRVGAWIWDPVIQPILSLPTWAVLAGLGGVLIWLGQPRRRSRRPSMG